jgi:hypothetical protein
MTQCVHVACDRPQRARTLCEMHYGQLKRSGLGPLQRQQPRQAKGVRLDAQLGQNSNCVDCGAKPFGGGMRCWEHFKARCDERAGTHLSSATPSAAGYASGCRCAGCRRGAALARSKARKAAA